VASTAKPVAAPSVSVRIFARSLYSFFRVFSLAFSYQLSAISFQQTINGKNFLAIQQSLKG